MNKIAGRCLGQTSPWASLIGPLAVCGWIAAAASLVGGCGGNQKVKATSFGTPEVSKENIDDRIGKSYGGPKIRVAVGDITELDAAARLFRAMGWEGIGPMLTEQIVTGLVQTGRVAVLERQQLNKVIGNVKREKESDQSRFFNQQSTTKIGEMLGAQAVLIGAITEFEPNVSGGEGGLSVSKLGGLKYHQNKAVVGIDIRLVEQETGRVIYSAHARGEISTAKFDGRISYSGVGVGSKGWSRTPLGVATRAAGKKAIGKLVEGLKGLPWEGGIVAVKGRNKVFIDAGGDLNIRKGDRFRVIHRGEEIVGPGGERLGYDETEGGWLEVMLVQEKMSIAKMVEGKVPKAGDRARVQP